MKYLVQFLIIVFFVFLGEILGAIIPLPIAGSIYGLLLLFFALCFKIVKLEWVCDVADWLHKIMALFFVAPAVAVLDIWADISNIWMILVLLLVAAYVVTMIITGITADYLLCKKDKGAKK
ncbi:MAG: CidA/LrgA family protein, partial [Alphaproteobacteria bacterium]